MILEYRYRFNNSGKSATLIAIANATEWPIRTLRAKGFLSWMFVVTRKMNLLDEKELEGCRRYQSYIYKTWDDFFKDEVAVEAPKAFINFMKQFARTHPLEGGQVEAFNEDNPFAALENQDLFQITR